MKRDDNLDVNFVMRRRRRWRISQHFLAILIVALTFGNKGAEAQLNGTTNRARGFKSIGNNNNENNHDNFNYLDQKIRQVRDVGIKFGRNDQSEKSSEMVNKAVEEAKAASEAQNFASQQAARHVKAQLADKARRAAKAAEAALSGKIALLEQLDEETKEAQIVFQDGSMELAQVRTSTNAAIRVARDSRQQLQMLSKAVNMVKTSIRNADVSVEGAKRSLTSKQKLLRAAKKRVEDLVERLHVAEEDLMKIRDVTIKAQEFARNARARVDRGI